MKIYNTKRFRLQLYKDIKVVLEDNICFCFCHAIAYILHKRNIIKNSSKVTNYNYYKKNNISNLYPFNTKFKVNIKTEDNSLIKYPELVPYRPNPYAVFWFDTIKERIVILDEVIEKMEKELKIK